MGEDLVYGEAEQFGVQLFELLMPLCKGNELRGANRCKVGRMAEEYYPFTFIILGEIIGPLLVWASNSGALSPIRGKVFTSDIFITNQNQKVKLCKHLVRYSSYG